METSLTATGRLNPVATEVEGIGRDSSHTAGHRLSGGEVLIFLHGLRVDRKRCRSLNSGHNLLREAAEAGLTRAGSVEAFTREMVRLNAGGLVDWTCARHDLDGDDLRHAAEFHLTRRGRSLLLQISGPGVATTTDTNQ